MKELSLKKMEEMHGGIRWSWSACLIGAISGGLMPVIATAWNPLGLHLELWGLDVQLLKKGIKQLIYLFIIVTGKLSKFIQTAS